ncbi:lysylphosphatidylglycerol synthase domain-containing protein [Agromyces laixinhei]|uniref:lysylphosphatidylglycerol synthase domain-containing protein n=1 Tax=Agromyces laixinhei TaxID=2585717 RepID=UPI0011170639|nr:lysylphosphatidylglycerol synthase domain-containing protein [Agromyces laixinhei]
MKKIKSLAPRALTVLRYVLVVVVIGFAVYYLVSQWDEISVALTFISWQSIVVSFLLVLVGLVCGTLSWIAVLNGLGPRVPTLRGAQVLLVGQLGKYVPGSVWSYVMQMELGRQYGILRPRVLVTALYAAGIGVVSSLMLGALALPVVVQGHPELMWLFLLLPIGLACLHPKVMTFLASFVLKLFRRPPLEHEVTFLVVGKAVGWSLLSYIAYGLHLWLLVNSLVDPDIGTLVLLTGAMALGFTVGLIAFIFPSGLGVREAILIGAMALLLTIPEATAVSLVSRAMFTAADLLGAGVAILFVVLLRRRLARETTAYLREEVQYEHSEDRAHSSPAATREDERE